MKGFVEFVRTQGVIGLAVGFILGGAVSGLVAALVRDIINPLLSIFLGNLNHLSELVVRVGPTQILIGDFIAVLVNFVVISAVVYFGIKFLKLDKLDRKSE